MLVVGYHFLIRAGVTRGEWGIHIDFAVLPNVSGWLGFSFLEVESVEL